jgi:hypothetical protein
MLDAAYHRDSIWREADQNKVVWVVVQFIPFVGTMAYYILVHRTLPEAEDRVRRSQPPTRSGSHALVNRDRLELLGG